MDKNYRELTTVICCYTCLKHQSDTDGQGFCARDSQKIIPVGLCDLYLSPLVWGEQAEAERGELIDMHVKALDQLTAIAAEIRDRLNRI